MKRLIRSRSSTLAFAELFYLEMAYLPFMAPAAAWAGAFPSHPRGRATHLFDRSQFKLRKSSWVILAVSPSVPPFAVLCVDDSNNAKFAGRKCQRRSWLNVCWWLRRLAWLRVGLSRGCGSQEGLRRHLKLFVGHERARLPAGCSHAAVQRGN